MKNDNTNDGDNDRAVLAMGVSPMSQTLCEVRIRASDDWAEIIGCSYVDLQYTEIAGQRVMLIFDDCGLMHRNPFYSQVGGITIAGRMIVVGIDKNENLVDLKRGTMKEIRRSTTWPNERFAEAERNMVLSAQAAQAIAHGGHVEVLPGGFGFITTFPGDGKPGEEK